MKVSVIVPTYNRGSQILLTLDVLFRQTIAGNEIEIIVVDDGSVDSTKQEIQQYIQEHPNISVQYFYYPANRGKASVCNDAIRMARGALIVFTDDDCIPEPDWIEMHIKRHSESTAPISVLGAVTFPKEWLQRSNFIRYVNSRYVGNRSLKSVGGTLDNLPPNYFGGLNISVPRE